MKTIKKVVKLFLPPIVIKTCRVLKHGNCDRSVPLQQSLLPQIEHHSEKMIVMGNGPSLNLSVEKYKDVIVANDRIAVNFFASSDLYEQLRPNIYVFADPAYFDVPENLKKSVEDLIRNLLQKTQWSMHVIVPLTAKDSDFVMRLRANNNIKVDFYSNINQDIGAMSKFEAWDKNLIGPPAQTVLNVALYLSLFWNYKETCLIGADSSFFEDLRIDQETNHIITIDKHFYKNQSVYPKFDAQRGGSMTGWSLHGLIYAYGRMFEGYSDLKEYADYKGLKVYNASEYSWINVFERRKLK